MPVPPTDCLPPQFTACIAAETEGVEAVLARRSVTGADAGNALSAM